MQNLDSICEWIWEMFEVARDSLVDEGIPRRLLKVEDIYVCRYQTCRAQVHTESGIIEVSEWWARLCYLQDDEWAVQRMMRHELGHLIVARHSGVEEAFKLPEYPHPIIMLCRYMKVAAGLIEYKDVHPEEGLCERVGSLNKRTMTKLVRVVS